MTIEPEITYFKIERIINSLKDSKYNSYFQNEPIYDDECNPKNVTYKTKDGTYFLVFSQINRLKVILAKFFRSIKVDNKRYFVIRIPAKKQDRIYLHNMLNNLKISIIRELTIPCDSALEFRGRTEKNIPRAWAEKLPLLETYLQNYVDNSYEIYQPPKVPLFPLFMPATATATKELGFNVGHFIDTYCLVYKTSPYNFYAYAVCSHLMLYYSLQHQTIVNTVIASIKDIRKLIPDNLSTDRFIREVEEIPFLNVRVKKIAGKNLKFIFDTDQIFNYCKNRQYFKIPVLLLKEVFTSNVFGKGGLPYFLMVMYAFHTPKNFMNYTPATIKKLTNIKGNRGATYTIDAINLPLLYLKEIKVIRFLKKLTTEEYKNNKRLLFSLNNLDKWEPPNPGEKKKALDLIKKIRENHKKNKKEN